MNTILGTAGSGGCGKKLVEARLSLPRTLHRTVTRTTLPGAARETTRPSDAHPEDDVLDALR